VPHLVIPLETAGLVDGEPTVEPFMLTVAFHGQCDVDHLQREERLPRVQGRAAEGAVAASAEAGHHCGCQAA